MSRDLKLAALGGLVVAIAILLFVSYQAITGPANETQQNTNELKRQLEELN